MNFGLGSEAFRTGERLGFQSTIGCLGVGDAGEIDLLEMVETLEMRDV